MNSKTPQTPEEREVAKLVYKTQQEVYDNFPEIEPGTEGTPETIEKRRHAANIILTISKSIRQLQFSQTRNRAVAKFKELLNWLPNQVAMAMPKLKAKKRKSTLQAALDYAAKGWPVFPISRNKKPLIKKWQSTGASIKSADIKYWWEVWPKANIAIQTGQRSGIVVIELDTKKLPPELTRLARSMTAQVETANGRHFYFQAPDEPLRTRQFDNFEVKAEGSNITAPPSLHKSGKRYKWTRCCEPKPMPNWLLKLARKKKPQTELKDGDTIPDGRRHNTLISMAGRYRNSGFGYKHLLVLLRLDNESCVPKKSDKEVKRIARDYSTKEMQREIVVIDADEIPELNLKWLCKNKFVCGGINIIVGYEDVGKTYIVVDIAYRVSVGAPWPDSTGKAPKGKVIICTNEAHMKGRIIKQLDVMGANIDNIKFFEMKADNQQFNFEQDLEQLKQLISTCCGKDFM